MRTQRRLGVKMAIIMREGVRGKICSTCKQWKPLDDFPTDPTHGKSQGGRHCRCKSCHRAGRIDREGRITQRKAGAWGSTSQDLLSVAARLFRLSRDESTARPDKNGSRFAYAGIPLLLAAVQSFAIEYEGILTLEPLPAELSAGSLAHLMETRYGVSGSLLEHLRDLIEIRNEIIHPVPLPSGTPDNWPDYLRRVKKKGLLTTTGNPNADYNLLAQVGSHKLFRWAINVTKKLYTAIINSNSAKVQIFQPFGDSNFKTFFG